MIKSPCVNICNVNEDGICIGCYRTIEEISNWEKYTPEERMLIMGDLTSDRMARAKVSSNKSMERVAYGTKRQS